MLNQNGLGIEQSFGKNHKILEFDDYKTDYLTDELSEVALRFINKQAEMTNLFSYFSPTMLHIRLCMPLKNTSQDFQKYGKIEKEEDLMQLW